MLLRSPTLGNLYLLAPLKKGYLKNFQENYLDKQEGRRTRKLLAVRSRPLKFSMLLIQIAFIKIQFKLDLHLMLMILIAFNPNSRPLKFWMLNSRRGWKFLTQYWWKRMGHRKRWRKMCWQCSGGPFKLYQDFSKKVCSG